MSSTYTTNKNYDKQGTGDNPGAWGPPLNSNFDLIDSNISATLSVALTNVNVTLSTNQASNCFYVLTGTLTGNVNISWPQVGGFYCIKNDTTGSFTVTIKTTAVGGLTFNAPQGGTVVAYCNATDMLPFVNQAIGNWKVPGDLTVTGSLNTSTQFAYYNPGGRLTLTSSTPVLSSDVTGATTIYYTPYLSNFIWLYDGTSWLIKAFSETSQLLSDTTKSPAAATLNSNYDMFGWSDSGTFRVTRGPAWTSDTGRGTGAGTTELTRVNGIYVNANAITNGPAANRGTYLGTIRTNASTAVPMTFRPSGAAGGTNNQLFLWNMYNRVDYVGTVRDSNTSWVLSTTLRPWDGATSNVNNRAAFVRGFDEEDVNANLTGRCTVINNGNINFGIGLDSTSAFASNCRPWGQVATSNTFWPLTAASFSGSLGLGYHYLQMLEQGPSDALNYGYVSTASAVSQSGMDFRFRA